MVSNIYGADTDECLIYLQIKIDRHHILLFLLFLNYVDLMKIANSFLFLSLKSHLIIFHLKGTSRSK